ncbi:PREDICTED: uncharacterized protein LOC106929584 isoform X1 [Poecilia mexicana]|uniref:uncharacterized protein LOC106929584 isoform X1 n=1 Tax=Poecilia mexicana TaxID=48701 RepID=UPI00072DF15E|nr:PREDICTED: uncharacterized protein LOC106929584 isoform X1 [Poecilia mexicana]XP_014862109.1 PREDICTED: uncharacterized protein LOC106929584 isoform X1 [Poecilia mexicana]
MFVILVLVLQLTEITGKFSPRFVVRDGDDVTLPCDNMRDEQDRCEKTNWLFSNSPDSSVTVSTDRQVSQKTERLEVAADCSLVIRNVSHEDVGFYTCRTSHISHNHDAHAHLFLITMTEKEDGDQMKFCCFVTTNEMCKHTVEWMYEGKAVEDTMIMKTSGCSVTAVIPESFLKNKPEYPEMFSCKVKDDSTERDQLFPLSPQSAGNDVSITNAGGEANETEPAFKNTSTTPLNLWLYVVVSVGSVALIITILVITLWKRREEERSIILQDVEQSLNSAAVLSNPGNGPNTVDPEDEVPYATICHTENAKSKTWDDEKPGDSVTYSSLKVDSPDSLNANR